MTRAASATLNAEANGLSEGLAETEGVASWLGLTRDLQYNMRQRDTLNREFSATAIISEGDSQLDMAAIIDARSLYDNLNREQYSGAERRAALEVCVSRDSLEALGGRARWVPHEENPADCLSKLKHAMEERYVIMILSRCIASFLHQHIICFTNVFLTFALA